MIKGHLFMYTESALHAGTGASVSAVDLPIQRETNTQYPMVQGSGVKGALRSHYVGDLADELFGPEPSTDQNNSPKHAGAISVGDAQIVLFPVRSLMGVFAYVTCAHALARLAREIDDFPALPAEPATGNALVGSNPTVKVNQQHVVLDEFTFKVEHSSVVTKIAEWLVGNALPQGDEYRYWRDTLAGRLVILPDTDFRDFALNSTQISTHVRLDSAKKTVKDGALWTTESVPSDALFASSVIVRKSRKGNSTLNSVSAVSGKLTAGFETGRIQLGGDETTGAGVVALRWLL
ncbi:MAG: type III-B CRISPR module RAMP protein Cmr4 [Chloroflexi bacterium]|jgi:CRISPR-associated protein Cmr4|nr:type III-B CRISPR module RAMP protein Cmr4 [Chloroflexota bacterium]OQY87042.1 MAG: type III-B CRISPR module RAMP protein Cmr4 [Anaerolineae bacterium UTCFX5]GIK29981.1 MAG: type III-B CRISPR module RAMP protein Cmr4 [Chloroflexota bacterium]